MNRFKSDRQVVYRQSREKPVSIDRRDQGLEVFVVRATGVPNKRNARFLSIIKLIIHRFKINI